MSLNEWGIIVGAAIVVFGVVLEGSEHVHDLKSKSWRPILPKIGFVVLVLGLAIETIFEARSHRDDSRFRGEATQKAAILEKEAASAKAHAADLEIVTYGRPISDQLKTAISDTCRGRFPDREISIGSSPSDDSSAVLAGELKSVLDKVGFKKLHDAIARQITVGSALIGVVITGKPDDGLVRTLQSALASTKELLVVMNPKPDWNEPVQIFVGARAFLPPSGKTPEWLEFLNRHHLVAE